MFIIWGWRGIPETIGQGQFYCPTCRRNSAYEHQQMRTYVTIFFIPVIPLAAGDRVVQCKQCQLSFREEVLLLSRPQEEAAASVSAGERVLGKRGEYWYPGTVRGFAGKKLKIDFDDGKFDVVAKSHATALDLRDGDPVFVRVDGASDYHFGAIISLDGDRLQVRLEDGRHEWTKLANIRVIWEEDGVD